MSAWVLIFAVLMLAFWIRIQGVAQLPEGQFTETDAYFYYWQAELISEHGHLPARDMHRWLPVGRDLGQTLNLYGYVLAYAHKAVAAVFSKVTLYHVTVYLPVICFCVGLAGLCLFLYHIYGPLFSSVVGVLLATLPGSIERSAAGFGDRDAFCLMLGLLAVLSYLAARHAETRRSRLIWTLTSGCFVFLGGISWEGFGVFTSIIILVEIWRFLTSEREEEFGLYALWVLLFVPTLYLVSPAYRNGYGFAEHLFAFVLVPPVVLLGLRALRKQLLVRSEKLRSHAPTLSLVLILASLAITLVYVWGQLDTFADTTVPLSKKPVMQAMTELRAPHARYWTARYGCVFIVGSLGFVLIPFSLWKKRGLFLSIPLALFTATSFYRASLENVWGESFGNALFGSAIVVCLLILMFFPWQRKNSEGPSELVSIAFTVWFIAWVALSRDAKRYDFFIGVALAFGAATFIGTFSKIVLNKIRVRTKYPHSLRYLRGSITALLLIVVMFFPSPFGHANRSIYAATRMRKALPGRTVIAEAFRWMNSNLPRDAIVAADWRYGSQLNVLAGVKTIIDQDTYIQDWIHLYHKHVVYSRTQREALEFLKTHGATHLMLVGQHPAKHFLRGHPGDAFVPVYPRNNFSGATLNLWELHYPPDIQTDPKYLKTGFQEIDAALQRH